MLVSHISCYNQGIMEKPHALIVGGSSGLGLALAKKLHGSYQVTITGRQDPKVDSLHFIPLDITSDIEKLSTDLERVVKAAPTWHLVVYAAGYFQDGRLTELDQKEVLTMYSVGLLAPTLLLQQILHKQTKLPELIAITSTSQWTPREYEPIYTATKAGLGMLANSLSLDTAAVDKVLVAGPSGMQTSFWAADGRDTSAMLDPDWVAAQILESTVGEFRYKFIKILREPPRVEEMEVRSE